MVALVSATTLHGLWRADQTGRTTPPCCLASAPVRGAAERGTLYAAADAGGGAGETRNGERPPPPYRLVSAACACCGARAPRAATSASGGRFVSRRKYSTLIRPTTPRGPC